MVQIPATATTVTIEIPSEHPQHQPRPTIIRWVKEKDTWQRYWSGQGPRDDRYIENSHDWGAKGGPQSEVNWSHQQGHKVTIQ